jgi:curved DNA-binding protein
MSVEFKDYYQSLGLEKNATADEIKKAFRRLARLYHPDVAKDKRTAEEKFKEINEAHEVLSDPVKRRKYDELGENGRAAGPGPAAGESAGDGPAHEFHFTGTGFSDFFEQYFGGGSRFGFGPGEPGFDPESGPSVRRGADIEGEILVTLDEVMHGTTRALTLRTVDSRTGGSGTHSFHVRIPAGAMEGRRIRVPGKGEPGEAGAPAGDLYLRVRYAAHPDFQARDGDLYHEVELAPWQAVLGATIVAPSFEGPIKVRIPSGTQPGAQLRVRGHGLPKGRGGERGDLHVVTQLRVPLQVTEKERKLWEELGRESPAPPRE